jgi:hypothetical protein
MKEIKYSSGILVTWKKPWNLDCKSLRDKYYLFPSGIKKDVVPQELRLPSQYGESTYFFRLNANPISNNNYAENIP